MNEQDYEISTDKTRLDLEMIHDFLANRSYWSAGVPFSVVEKSIENSLCFGVYDLGRQVGFARVVTDLATIAYIGDVFILEHYRGRGLGKKLIKTLMDHPELQGLFVAAGNKRRSLSLQEIRLPESDGNSVRRSFHGNP
jgi:GNAT superfamily N-acetyltransferase